MAATAPVVVVAAMEVEAAAEAMALLTQLALAAEVAAMEPADIKRISANTKRYNNKKCHFSFCYL